METVTINGFEIYSDGRVKNTKTGNFLNPGPSGNGYLYVNLNGRKNRKREAIHVLVATYFIPNPNNLQTVDHINKIRTDNRKENLRWLSLEDNAREGTRKEVIGFNTITGEVKIFRSETEAGKFINRSQQSISLVCKTGKETNGWTFKKYEEDRD